MPRSKRRELTTDDLMRMQESGPSRKRPRRELPSQEVSEDEVSEPKASGSGSDEEDTGAEDINDHSAGIDGTGEGSDEDSVSGEKPQLPGLPPVDRFASSRVSAVRRADKVLTTGATLAKSAVASWDSLGISPVLQAALTSMSIRAPTEIQAACIPPLIAGRDCIGNAKTGSGKTIAFALPILQRLSSDPYGVFALVLTPTRELAFQIAEQFAVLGGAVSVRTAVIVGGMDMMAQALELGQRPHVVIATPGRIVDHLRSSTGEWDLSRVKFLVLDEADRLLTPTFAPELQYLFGVLPRERQTCLFTATWTDSVEQLASAAPKPGKQKPFVHKIAATVETVEQLKQYYLLVPSHVREAYLFHLLCNPPESTLHLRRAPPEQTKPSRKANKPAKTARAVKKSANKEEEELEQPPPTIVFVNKPRTAAFLTTMLRTLGIKATALHSRLTQRERLSSLSLFRASVVPVLVSTDVGARGLDIEAVALVVNWDMPQMPEEYTHRVGRTARAGRGGVAVSFVTERDEERVLAVEERIHTALEEMLLPEARVLEKLNAVATAKRLANMELHDNDFGRREEVHKAKTGSGNSRARLQ